MSSQNTAASSAAELMQRRKFKKLSNTEVSCYIDRISDKLSKLSEVLSRRNRGSEENDDFVVPYVNVIVETLDAMKLKYQLPEEQQINFSFLIDSVDCGFPTYRDFYAIRADQEIADHEISTLGSKEKLVELIKSAVMTKKSPEKIQNALRRLNFYNKIKKANLLEDSHLSKPVRGGEDDERIDFTLDFTCLERTTALPTFYRMWLRQNADDIPIDETMKSTIKNVFYQASSGIEDPLILISALDNLIDEIHPKILYKYTLGPYYDELTENSTEMNDLLKATPGSSILCFSLSKVLSVGTRERSENWWRRLTNRIVEKEYYGPVATSRGVITDFRVAQRIKQNRLLADAKLYAVTESGGISL